MATVTLLFDFGLPLKSHGMEQRKSLQRRVRLVPKAATKDFPDQAAILFDYVMIVIMIMRLFFGVSGRFQSCQQDVHFYCGCTKPCKVLIAICLPRLTRFACVVDIDWDVVI